VDERKNTRSGKPEKPVADQSKAFHAFALILYGLSQVELYVAVPVVKSEEHKFTPKKKCSVHGSLMGTLVPTNPCPLYLSGSFLKIV
jgi:hypothetical protein